MPFDETFHLDPAVRAHIAPDFDADALERLLQHLGPLDRPTVLDEFLLPEQRVYAPVPNQWWVLKAFTDTVLNEMLAEVWQPFWDSQPVERLTDPHCPYPGQALARRRRNEP